MKTKNILLSGVGGQGTITAAKLLTTGLMEAGYDVKMSEIHGMSQRGGTVLSQVRYGDDVQSPVIERGTADIIVAFEEMEAMRYLDYLKKDGIVVINETRIWPLPVVIGSVKYPDGILEAMQDKARIKVINATAMAEELGNPKVMNVILLGAVVKSMHLDDIDWASIISKNVKPKFVDLNIEAFKRGAALV
ncbi:MAG: indolepyruvate oxidoreductase subunit beta [Eubacteriaceae bacterium]|jgi:indolepyruvate ferredoxin oxidoreductase beta subunit